MSACLETRGVTHHIICLNLPSRNAGDKRDKLKLSLDTALVVRYDGCRQPSRPAVK